MTAAVHTLWARVTRLLGARVGVLLVARFVEQACLGLASLVLARVVGVHGYAPLMAIFVVNSFAVTLSDFGLGTAIMGAPVGAGGTQSLWRMRAGNAAVLACTLVGAACTSGDLRALLAGGGAIWLLSAEAFVRKSALVRLGEVRRVARAEILGSLLFLAGTGGAVVDERHALLWLIGALLTKHTLESLLAFGWRDAFGTSPGDAPVGAVWVAQVLNFLCANVDYVVVGVLISSAAFSVYSLGFRVASLVASQVAFAAVRVMLGDFADAATTEARQRVVHARTRQMFQAGAPAAVVLLLAAPLAPVLLGDSWRSLSGVVVVLALAVPWRMALSVTLSMAMGSGLTRRLVTWECMRFACIVVVLCCTAAVSFPVFVVAVSVTMVATSWAEHHVVTRALGVRAWPPLAALTAVAAVAVVVAGSFLLVTPT